MSRYRRNKADCSIELTSGEQKELKRLSQEMRNLFVSLFGKTWITFALEVCKDDQGGDPYYALIFATDFPHLPSSGGMKNVQLGMALSQDISDLEQMVTTAAGSMPSASRSQMMRAMQALPSVLASSPRKRGGMTMMVKAAEMLPEVEQNILRSVQKKGFQGATLFAIGADPRRQRTFRVLRRYGYHEQRWPMGIMMVKEIR